MIRDIKVEQNHIMPIYMDRHDVSETVTAENMAQLHQQDLKIQDNYSCRGMTYWFDGERHTAFCLIEAPSKDAVMEMHQQAHGDVPNTIIEVDAAVVEAFLGRITDPLAPSKNGLHIIDDPAFRILMIVRMDDPVLLKYRVGEAERDKHLAGFLDTVRRACIHAGGQVASLEHGQFTLAFRSAAKAIQCAEDILENLPDRDIDSMKLRTCINAGNPVSGTGRLFGAVTDLAGFTFYRSEPGEVVITEQVADLAGYVRMNSDPVPIKQLSEGDEEILRRLFGVLEANIRNESYSVEDLGSALLMSKSSLNRMTRSLTGHSPNNLLQTYRLDTALRLLRESGAGVADVSFETGFGSPSYFSKSFKRQFGLSPSEYHAETAG